jgi:hypothetical protein
VVESIYLYCSSLGGDIEDPGAYNADWNNPSVEAAQCCTG